MLLKPSASSRSIGRFMASQCLTQSAKAGAGSAARSMTQSVCLPSELGERPSRLAAGPRRTGERGGLPAVEPPPPKDRRSRHASVKF